MVAPGSYPLTSQFLITCPVTSLFVSVVPALPPTMLSLVSSGAETFPAIRVRADDGETIGHLLQQLPENPLFCSCERRRKEEIIGGRH